MIGSDMDVSAEFERLARLQPRLRDLESNCRSCFFLMYDRRCQIWDREVKPGIRISAGWHATGNPELRTEFAYDVVYRHLLSIMGI